MPESGVLFNAPPNNLLPSISKSIADAIAQLPPGANGAVVGIATEKGANAAVVAKVRDGWEIQAWIGKKWVGPVEGGGSVRVTW